MKSILFLKELYPQVAKGKDVDIYYTTKNIENIEKTFIKLLASDNIIYSKQRGNNEWNGTRNLQGFKTNSIELSF